MSLRPRLSEFLSSYGPMCLGVILLFYFSVSLVPSGAEVTLRKFPAAGNRGQTVGGDECAVLPVSRPTKPLAKDNSAYVGALTATSTLAVDDQTGTVLFEKNAREIRPLASVTKLMSALVLLDIPVCWASTTVIAAADWDGSSHHVNVGEEFDREDLWHIALIGSSNTAINALVRGSGISLEEFVARMNKKAAALGLNSLHFVEPTGLNSDNKGNAFDIARLLEEALKSDKILAALQVGEYYAKPLGAKKQRRVWSTNWLLTNWIPNDFPVIHIAGKTGYIADSLYNFSVRLSDDSGHSVRVVILGSVSNESRFSEARDLATWSFAHYLWPDQEGYDKLAE